MEYIVYELEMVVDEVERLRSHGWVIVRSTAGKVELAKGSERAIVRHEIV